MAVLGQWVTGWVGRLYSGRYAAGSHDEFARVAAVVLVVGGVLLGTNLFAAHPYVPQSLPLTAAALAVVLCWAGRMAACRYRQPGRAARARDARRPGSGYLPVALIDDNPDKRGVRVCGIPVRGTPHDLPTLIARTEADAVMIAVHDAGAGLLREVSRVAGAQGVGVTLAPPLRELFRPRIGLNHMPVLDRAVLLGRRQIDTGAETAGRVLAGRRVLVTGAGGSIGSELCRQINRLGPTELFMLDRGKVGAARGAPVDPRHRAARLAGHHPGRHPRCRR